MTRTPSTPCPRWCQYADARNHPDNHITHVGDVVPSTYNHVRVVAVTVESGGVDEPLPVVAMLRDDTGAACTARLTWDEAQQVARMLDDARHRHGATD